MIQNSKVIVTGGAGFIGSNLVNELVKEGYDVHVIDNLSEGKKERVNPKATLHIADITNLEQIKPIFRGAEFVFHMAAMARVQYSIDFPIKSNEANILGTLNVLIASHENKVKRVVYSASSSAYGDQDKLPLVETMYPNPKSPYGAQKYMGEVYAKVWSEVYGLSTVSLRYFNVYGPGQSADGAYVLVIPKLLKQKNNGGKMTITGDGLQTRDFTHVRDVVRANILAAKSDKVGKGEVINIGAGKGKSILEVVKTIGGEYEFIPARIEPRNTLADASRARELLGWEPKENFEKAIDELKNQ